jgi:hypothetical protein
MNNKREEIVLISQNQVSVISKLDNFGILTPSAVSITFNGSNIDTNCGRIFQLIKNLVFQFKITEIEGANLIIIYKCFLFRSVH